MLLTGYPTCVCSHFFRPCSACFTIAVTFSCSGGVYTPAVAFADTPLIENLKKTGKVVFEVVEPSPWRITLDADLHDTKCMYIV